MTGGRPPREIATSRSVRLFLPCRGRDRSRTRRTREPVESPQTLVQASRQREASRAGARPPAHRAPRRRARRRGARARPLPPARAARQRAASAWSGAPTTSSCTARWRVKRVWLGAGGGPIDSERATREALAAARLSHPAIVALHEACAKDGAFYLISELVDGDTLAQLIAAEALEDEEILEIGAGARERARARPRARGDPPRHQAAERARARTAHRRTPQTPQTLLAAAKLTDFGGASARRRGGAHAHRRRARHARLHGARAERGPRGGSRGRPVLARARRLRGAVRGQPRARRHARRDGAADRARAAAAAARAPRSASASSRARSTARSRPRRRSAGRSRICA